MSGDAENRPEAEVQIQQTQEEEQEDSSMARASQVSPRQVEAARPNLERSLPSSSPGTPAPIEPDMLSFTEDILEPPITKTSLSELDVAKIIHNCKLRHDINFDPDLHFRPNLEGDKGRLKQNRHNSFWRSLRDQLTQFVVDRDGFFARNGDGDDWCLPLLLKTVKSILEGLVPQRDLGLLDEGLNIELLMQQFYHGILDLEKLAEWLRNVLKSHCAPMRDDEVDSMYKLVRDGNREGDLDKLVCGLRDLLSILEHMKLDVANHQIRCMRSQLIQETIVFEQRTFIKRINTHRFSVEDARLWYKDAHKQFSSLPARGFGDLSVFFEALSRLILPSAASDNRRIPETFQHDHDRLLKLRMDMLDAVNLDICMRLYNDLESVARYSSVGHFGCSGGDRTSRVLSSDFNLGTSDAGSRPSSFTLSCAGSDTSSRHSSMIVPSYVAPDSYETQRKAQTLYNSLVALLSTAPLATIQPSTQIARWRAVAPSMAIEILRHLEADFSMLPELENKLAESLCQFDSQLYRDTEQSFHQRLLDELSNKVHEYKGLSGFSLYTTVSEKRMVPGTNSMRDFIGCLRRGLDEGAIDDLAMRLAHAGILHWRVWAGTAYVQV